MSKYIIDTLNNGQGSIPIPIGHADTFEDAMDEAESYCEQWDEQLFVGVWLGEHLVAIFDSNDWFTK